MDVASMGLPADHRFWIARPMSGVARAGPSGSTI